VPFFPVFTHCGPLSLRISTCRSSFFQRNLLSPSALPSTSAESSVTRSFPSTTHFPEFWSFHPFHLPSPRHPHPPLDSNGGPGPLPPPPVVDVFHRFPCPPFFLALLTFPLSLVSTLPPLFSFFPFPSWFFFESPDRLLFFPVWHLFRRPLDLPLFSPYLIDSVCRVLIVASPSHAVSPSKGYFGRKPIKAVPYALRSFLRPSVASPHLNYHFPSAV